MQPRCSGQGALGYTAEDPAYRPQQGGRLALKKRRRIEESPDALAPALRALEAGRVEMRCSSIRGSPTTRVYASIAKNVTVGEGEIPARRLVAIETRAS